MGGGHTVSTLLEILDQHRYEQRRYSVTAVVSTLLEILAVDAGCVEGVEHLLVSTLLEILDMPKIQTKPENEFNKVSTLLEILGLHVALVFRRETASFNPS